MSEKLSEKNIDVTETCMDHVFDGQMDTETVYKTSFKPIVEKAVRGLNGCIMAYGQTSSGKTYSMLGSYAGGTHSSSSSSSSTSPLRSARKPSTVSEVLESNKINKGIIQLACEDAFEKMDELKRQTGMSHRVKFSLCEVYMEKVSDLLAVQNTLKPQYLSVKE